MENYSKLFILPRDGREPILNLINDAKSTICIVIYEMYDEILQNALVDAAKRGVKIRIIYDNGETVKSPEHLVMVENEKNFLLQNPNINGLPSSNIFSVTHEKVMIVDSSTIGIFTLNFVDVKKYNTFLHSREFGIITNEKADVETLINQFELDWNNALLGNKDIFPNVVPGSRLFFSPSINELDNKYSSHYNILNLLYSAQNSLNIYVELFINKNHFSLVECLNDIAARGVEIRIIAYKFEIENPEEVLDKSIKIILVPLGHIPFCHAKSIIVDEIRASIMSVNIEANSIFYEREAGIVVDDKDIVSQLVNQFNDDWKNFCNLVQFNDD